MRNVSLSIVGVYTKSYAMCAFVCFNFYFLCTVNLHTDIRSMNDYNITAIFDAQP